ncbi:MAG: glycosyltransferase [Flavobacteriaceae bacterium]|nr:glycosyltransferase [Flavobacteriaceae bacterium]|tara:strand:+ start:18460 stop:19548 length:1089 start_codon:yes stop_codon:yes gene_type:complete
MKSKNYTFQHLKKKTILVAPLYWGLGHATRCIPIIQELLHHGYDVLLGSDGAALELLKKEFPTLPFIELPAYNITYPKKGEFFKLKLFLKLPEIKKAMAAEKKQVKKLIEEGRIQGLISDNRLGVRSKKIPSVFITHQVNVLSGNTSYFSSKMHQKIIKKYDACWVPDLEGPLNLSGTLGHPKKTKLPLTYIGPLSRMKTQKVPMQYDVLILLSGPEPQRTLLEVKLIEVFSKTQKKVMLVRGVVEAKEQSFQKENINIVNFLTSEALEKAINESNLVVCRSGYTTIMDLAAMEKNAFFIPTPGQFEQKYLAKQLKQKGIAPSCKQENFTIEKLQEVPLYKGLKNFSKETDFKKLFGLFERE